MVTEKDFSHYPLVRRVSDVQCLEHELLATAVDAHCAAEAALSRVRSTGAHAQRTQKRWGVIGAWVRGMR